MKKIVLSGMLLLGSVAFAKSDYFVGVGIGIADFNFITKFSNYGKIETKDDAGFRYYYGGVIVNDTHKISIGGSNYNTEEWAKLNSFNLKYSYYFLSKQKLRPFAGISVATFIYEEDLDNDFKENKFKTTTNFGLLHFGFDYDFSKHHSVSAVYEMSVYANSDSDIAHTTNGDTISMEIDEIRKWSVNYQYKF